MGKQFRAECIVCTLCEKGDKGECVCTWKHGGCYFDTIETADKSTIATLETKLAAAKKETNLWKLRVDEAGDYINDYEDLQAHSATLTAALEKKVVKCCGTCDSFINSSSMSNPPVSNINKHGHCPFESCEKYITDTCDNWSIEALAPSSTKETGETK